MNEKIAEFAELRGTVPDEKIAEMADVSVDEVKAHFDGPPKAKVEAKPEPKKKARASKSKTTPEPKAKVEAKPEPKKKAPPAPRNVRVVRSQRVRGIDGRTLHLRRADVYGGAVATFLWERHRDLVEPFPPAKG